jgi:hypothetical protein
MNSNMNSLLAEQHQPDRIRIASHDRRGHSEPRTRGDGTPTRWISLAHAALNQAKMAAPRAQHLPLPVPQSPAAPDRGTIGPRDGLRGSVELWRSSAVRAANDSAVFAVAERTG